MADQEQLDTLRREFEEAAHEFYEFLGKSFPDELLPEFNRRKTKFNDKMRRYLEARDFPPKDE